MFPTIDCGSCGLLLHLGIRLFLENKKLSSSLVCNLTIGFQIMLSRKMQKKDATNVATDHGDLK
jgi:hypothetical protein